MMARCEGNEIEVLDRVFLPHSLGSLYTMICEFIGYTQYGDEGKVMGLAPYGKETYCDQVSKMVAAKDGGFELDLSYFKPLGSNQGMQVCRTARFDWLAIFPIAWRNYSANRASHMRRSRSATWIWHSRCSIASRKYSFIC